jgi:hypothetical protein
MRGRRALDGGCAVVAGEAAEIDAADVFAEADNIEPVSVAVPAEVVAQIVNDETDPRSVVLDLLRTAIAAGDGVILDLAQVLAQHLRRGRTRH